MRFIGPDGPYEAIYDPDAENSDEGRVTIVGLSTEPLSWGPYICNRSSGGWEVGGISHGTKEVWGDVYWFSLFTCGPPRIEYWGNQVLIRIDPASA